jgi:hypothetical protein
MEKSQIETEGQVYEGAGRACPERSEGMPAPQRAGHPRYIGCMGFHFHVVRPRNLVSENVYH